MASFEPSPMPFPNEGGLLCCLCECPLQPLPQPDQSHIDMGLGGMDPLDQATSGCYICGDRAPSQMIRSSPKKKKTTQFSLRKAVMAYGLIVLLVWLLLLAFTVFSLQTKTSASDLDEIPSDVSRQNEITVPGNLETTRNSTLSEDSGVSYT